MSAHMALCVIKFLTTLLIAHAFMCFSMNVAFGKDYYIFPENESDASDLCNLKVNQQCFTLNQFASGDFFDYVDSSRNSSIVLILLPGLHMLDFNLTIIGAYRFEMISLSSRAAVECDKSSTFFWSNVQHVFLSDIEFNGCGMNSIERVATFDIVNSTFRGNANSGTALMINKSNVTISRCSFLSNIIGNSHTPSFNQNPTLQQSIHDHFISDNLRVGGAIFTTGESILKINESLFEDNKAHIGGAIFADQSSKITISHSVISSKLNTNNDNTFISGASLHAEGGCRVNIDNTVIANNRATKSGGAISLYNSSLTVHHSAFVNNTAVLGGVLFAYMSNINLTDSHMSDNKANCRQTYKVNADLTENSQTDERSKNHCDVGGEYGGVLHVERCRIFIKTTKFFNNTATKDGGVIQAYFGVVEFADCNCTGNRAGQHGGVVSASNSDLRVSKCYFYNNHAGSDGGAFFITQRTNSEEPNSTVHNKHTFDDFSGIIINDCTFWSNSAEYGGALFLERTTANIIKNLFIYNSAIYEGGAVILQESHATVYESNFTQNRAHHNGGGIYPKQNSTAMIDSCLFHLNSATNDAGAILGYQSTINVSKSALRNNSAKWAGAVAAYEGATINIEACVFVFNRAEWGGAMGLHLGTLIVNKTIISHQSAEKQGGVVYVNSGLFVVEESSLRSNQAVQDGGAIIGVNARLTIIETNFSHNRAGYYGSVIHLSQGTIKTYGSILVEYNSAKTATIYLYDSKANFTGSMNLRHNQGSLYTFNSHLTFINKAIFMNSSSVKMIGDTNITGATSDSYKLEGGALSVLFGSVVIFSGVCEITNNRAIVGGGLFISESKVYFERGSLITNNNALDSGGGIYLYNSEIDCNKECNLLIQNNSATTSGGGMHSIGSLLKVYIPQSAIDFVENRAEMGGGIFLEMNSKIYVLETAQNSFKAINFTANRAMIKGGAMYVRDGLHSCKSLSTLPYVANECLLQTIEQHDIKPSYLTTNKSANKTGTMVVNFLDNTALSGSSVYGGFIGSCSVTRPNVAKSIGLPQSNYNVSELLFVKGIEYLKNISDVALTSISSDPVKICLCRDGRPDCSFPPCPVKIMKGSSFAISVAAVDQADQSISATVYSSFKSKMSDFKTHFFSSNQSTGVCTNLTFQSDSPGDIPDVLLLQVEGPCRETEISKLRLQIDFYSCPKCPIGFEPLADSTRCECTCDLALQPYVTKCNSSTRTLLRESNFWLTYVNKSGSSGYLLYDYCPLDYCLPPSSRVELNLNVDNGSDAQCAFNRVGLLCGVCQAGYSLSLSSSQCISCEQNTWPVTFVLLTLAGLFAGVVLTFIILVLNLTVSVGRINGVVFYANILAMSYSTFLYPNHPAGLSGFIAEIALVLNLELPYDVCYVRGLDTYSKTWLQLCFPIYMFIIVFVIIKLSQYSLRFSNLIGRKNPVATLSTLILLSFMKILTFTISAFSLAELKYPDGSHKLVWSPDATLEYLSGKHVALIITSIFIYIVGFAYVALLFSWQWILRLQNWQLFKWTGNARFFIFMETYTAPYNAKHRYWTGLLLIIRIVLYIVTAVNKSGNPRIILLSTAFAMGCLLLWKSLIGARIYKDTMIDILETITVLNIFTLALFNWFALDAKIDIINVVITTASVGITYLLLFIAVIEAVRLLRCCQRRSKCCKRRYERVPEDEAIQLPERRADAEMGQPQLKEPTQTVIDFPKQKQQ